MALHKDILKVIVGTMHKAHNHKRIMGVVCKACTYKVNHRDFVCDKMWCDFKSALYEQSLLLLFCKGSPL